jgi:hypothetical protein
VGANAIHSPSALEIGENYYLADGTRVIRTTDHTLILRLKNSALYDPIEIEFEPDREIQKKALEQTAARLAALNP